MNTSIYIAGPMTGYKEYNFPAFYKAEEELRSWGWRPINPARVDEEAGFDPLAASTEDLHKHIQELVSRDLSLIIKDCAAIYMLKGWENSNGARTEWQTALWLQMHKPFDILYESSIRFPTV